MQLRAAGLQHGDLKATNFVVHEDQVALVDFDALEPGDNESDMARFLRNWVDDEALQSRWRERLRAAHLIP